MIEVCYGPGTERPVRVTRLGKRPLCEISADMRRAA